MQRIEMNGYWIEVEETSPGHFTIVNDSMTVKDGDCMIDPTALGYVEWDDEVENLDTDSDPYECFGISQDLQWNEVSLGVTSFEAPSIERLKEALSHVTLMSWCPGDI